MVKWFSKHEWGNSQAHVRKVCAYVYMVLSKGQNISGKRCEGSKFSCLFLYFVESSILGIFCLFLEKVSWNFPFTFMLDMNLDF